MPAFAFPLSLQGSPMPRFAAHTLLLLALTLPLSARGGDAPANKTEPVVARHAFSFKGHDSKAYDVRLKPGQALRIMLDDNGAGTGNAWFLTDADSKEELAAQGKKGWKCTDAKAGVLTQRGAPLFTPPAKAAPGAAGTLTWSFLAKKEGRQNLRFAFRHAWEKAGPTDVVVTYAVTVDKGAKPGVAPAAGEVTWEELVAIVHAGTVKSASQAHSLRVSVTMEDGKTYDATEPKIDDVIHLVANHRNPPKKEVVNGVTVETQSTPPSIATE